MKPIIKWSGGKTWAIEYVKNLITPEVKDLFKNYVIQEVSVKRTVSCKGTGRSANELIITNINC